MSPLTYRILGDALPPGSPGRSTTVVVRAMSEAFYKGRGQPCQPLLRSPQLQGRVEWQLRQSPGAYRSSRSQEDWSEFRRTKA